VRFPGAQNCNREIGKFGQVPEIRFEVGGHFGLDPNIPFLASHLCWFPVVLRRSTLDRSGFDGMGFGLLLVVSSLSIPPAAGVLG